MHHIAPPSVRNKLDGIRAGSDTAEEKISKCEDTENKQTKKQTKNPLSKMEHWEKLDEKKKKKLHKWNLPTI